MSLTSSLSSIQFSALPTSNISPTPSISPLSTSSPSFSVSFQQISQSHRHQLHRLVSFASNPNTHFRRKSKPKRFRVNCSLASEPLKVMISGAPASGKGTQCELIVNQFGLVHISTGDILRAEVSAGTDIGKKAKEFMNAGQLVPDEIVTAVILKAPTSIILLFPFFPTLAFIVLFVDGYFPIISRRCKAKWLASGWVPKKFLPSKKSGKIED